MEQKMRILVFSIFIFFTSWAISPNLTSAIYTFLLVFLPFSLVYGFPTQLHSLTSSAARMLLMLAISIIASSIFAKSTNLTLKQGDQFVFLQGSITYFGAIYHFGFYLIAFVSSISIYFITLNVMQKMKGPRNG